ncbi:MAG: SufB/sufD domain protein [Candidatus Uhrbacteria bacterium GW2011_GWD2_52_7]|uniref:SufB/sufD domain protein n=1 Tax=Candidatus Uhrbacteria bacterium GW2011_GWD2_52_7 TaxID=1618989 RepID=A0A0G1XFE8_9BACT|nr:MAG: SufB/sufD domain protein [Candidatus Uhrbacteria bacterium GW2011_GWD2_52_7]
MTSKHAMKPLSENPLIVNGWVGDLPTGPVVLAAGERRVLRYNVTISSQVRHEIVCQVPVGAELIIEGAVAIETSGIFEQTIMVRGSGKCTLRQATELTGGSLLRRYAFELRNAGVCDIADQVNVLGIGARTSVDVHGVLRDSARSTVRGRIHIAPQAHGAQANMQAHHLLLSEQAFAAAIPELSVHVDDVMCRHGASISRPSDAAMGYMQSRGLSSVQAEDMLAEAFLCPIFYV